MKRLLLMFAVLVGLFPTAVYATYQADDTLGQPVATTNCLNYQTTADGLSSPLDVDLDTMHHEMYVDDLGNNRVLVFDLDSSNNPIDRTADYVIGQSDFSTCVAQPLSATSLSGPRGLVHDDARQLLYVADSGNNRVMVFDTSALSNGMAAVHELGQTGFTATNSACSSATVSTVCAPNTAEIDTVGQRLFVADGNSRIDVFDVASITDGEPMISVLCQSDFTSAARAMTQNRCNYTHGVAYDPATQYLFVSDDLDGRIMVFDVASASVGENALYVLGAGSNFTTSESAALSRKGLGRTLGVTVDSAGHRLFASDFDNWVIRVWDFDDFPLANAASESFVLGAPNFTTIGVSKINAFSVPSPHGIQYEADTGKLYVTPSHNRVSIFDVSTITNGEDAVDEVGQTTSGGAAVFTNKDGANNGPNARGVNTPLGDALDTVHHRLFISDSNNARILVHQLDANNNLVDETADYVIGQADFTSNVATTSQNHWGVNEHDLVYDSEHDRLYAANFSANNVLMWDLSGGITNGMNASAVIGQSSYTATAAATTQAGLNGPTGLAYDSGSHYLYVSNYNVNRITVYDTTSGVTNGMNAKAVLGQSTWTGASAGTTPTTLRNPYGLCVDTAGRRLFASDLSNHRVIEYDITTVASGQAAVGVLGQANLSAGGAATTQSGMSGPVSCAYDGVHNRLYVMENGNKRITVFDVATLTNGENAVGVLGQNDFVTATAAATPSTGQFNGAPYYLEFDSTNDRLWVSDYPNNRILKYDFLKLPATSLPNATADAAYSESLGELGAQGTKTFTLVSGALPAGLSLGSLSGTPTETGTFNFSVLASDTNSVGTWWDTQSYTLTVDAAPAPTPTPTPTPAGAVVIGPWLNTATPPAPSASPMGGSIVAAHLTEGDTVSAAGSADPDVYIVNAAGFKRLFLNPIIFSFYGHLGGFSRVKSISAPIRDSFPTSGLFRNCETNDHKVYGVEITGEDTGTLHHINITGDEAVAQDPDFFKKVFCINTNEFNWYTKGTPYTSLSQVLTYQR